jgi:hypothetical protein
MRIGLECRLVYCTGRLRAALQSMQCLVAMTASGVDTYLKISVETKEGCSKVGRFDDILRPDILV